MKSEFSKKLKTAFALHKQKVVQNIDLLSDGLKRKLEEIICKKIRMKVELLLREALSPDMTGPIDQVLSTASRHRWSNTLIR
jgi:hypothetical protein